MTFQHKNAFEGSKVDFAAINLVIIHHYYSMNAAVI